MPNQTSAVESAEQRTDLAWIRSGLAVALIVAVILRHLGTDPATSERLPVALAAGGLFTWSLAYWGMRRLARSDGARAAFRGVLAGLVTAGTLLLAAAALTLILLPGP